MEKNMKSGRKYFIINIDEPYAEQIYDVLKAGQTAKGQWPEGDISFDEWKEQTFGANQSELKAFRVDDYQTVAARSLDEAKRFYIDELGGEAEDFEGYEIDPDNEIMWFPMSTLPSKYHIPPFRDFEGDKCVEVTLRVAMDHRSDADSYLLSVSSELL